MANANGKHRRFPEGVRNFSTICDLYRQLTDIVALMSLMDFEKLRGKSLKIGKYLKTSDTFRNVGCVPLLTVMANANGKHRSFPEGYRSFFDHFRSLPASHGYYCINEYDGLRKTRGHSLKISKFLKTLDAFRNVVCAPFGGIHGDPLRKESKFFPECIRFFRSFYPSRLLTDICS